MSSADNYIAISITLTQPGITTPGFGTPLIPSATATFPERTRLYTDTDGMVSDGFAADSPEVRAATVMLAQSPHVPQWKVGRLALPPTLVYVISVAAVRNSHDYVVNVAGEGVTTTTVTITSDGSATNDEIIDALVTGLNLVVGKNYTAAATGAGGSHVCTVTASAAGDWFSLEMTSIADLAVKATHADPGFATDLAAIKVDDSDWYLIVNHFNSDAVVAAIATWAEANGKAFWPDSNQTDIVTTGTGNGDPIDDLNTAGWRQSMGLYHPDPSEFFGAAWASRYLCTDPGRAVPGGKNLIGISPVNLTTTQRANLIAKRGNSYEAVFSTAVTYRGTVPNSQYLYFDVVRDVAAWALDVQASGFGAIVAEDKITFTDEGTPKIGAAIRGANKRAEDNTTAARGTSFCTIPLVANVSATDKANRNLTGIKAGFELAGAVQGVGVVATISF